MRSVVFLFENSRSYIYAMYKYHMANNLQGEDSIPHIPYLTKILDEAIRQVFSMSFETFIWSKKL